MNDIDVDQPVRVTPEPAQVIARILSAPGGYPDTAAEDVTRELGKPHGGADCHRWDLSSMGRNLAAPAADGVPAEGTMRDGAH